MRAMVMTHTHAKVKGQNVRRFKDDRAETDGQTDTTYRTYRIYGPTR